MISFSRLFIENPAILAVTDPSDCEAYISQSKEKLHIVLEQLPPLNLRLKSGYSQYKNIHLLARTIHYLVAQLIVAPIGFAWNSIHLIYEVKKRDELVKKDKFNLLIPVIEDFVMTLRGCFILGASYAMHRSSLFLAKSVLTGTVTASSLGVSLLVLGFASNYLVNFLFISYPKLISRKFVGNPYEAYIAHALRKELGVVNSYGRTLTYERDPSRLIDKTVLESFNDYLQRTEISGDNKELLQRLNKINDSLCHDLFNGDKIPTGCFKELSPIEKAVLECKLTHKISDDPFEEWVRKKQNRESCMTELEIRNYLLKNKNKYRLKYHPDKNKSQEAKPFWNLFQLLTHLTQWQLFHVKNPTPYMWIDSLAKSTCISTQSDSMKCESSKIRACNKQ